jgi:hypothetical protein
MIPRLFEEGKPDQAFPTELLMTKVVEPAVAEQFGQIVATYYNTQIASYVKRGDLDSAAQKFSAAKLFRSKAGDQVVQSTEANKEAAQAIQDYAANKNSWTRFFTPQR